jgi:hypothetical protein
MTDNNQTSLCPFCKKENQCAVEAGNKCWCQKKHVPADLVNLLPPELKNESCICSACIEDFRIDPKRFLINKKGKG